MAPPYPWRESPAVPEDGLMLSYFIKKIIMYFEFAQ
jgi:hypothetical protein